MHNYNVMLYTLPRSYLTNKPGVYVMIINAGGGSKYSMRIILYKENM